jgi:6-pyruvoyl-tetrahydropterin synthase related domain
VRRHLNNIFRLGLAVSLFCLVLAVLRWGPVYARPPWPVRAVPSAVVALPLAVLCALTGVTRGPRRTRPIVAALAVALAALAIVVSTRGPAGLSAEASTPRGDLAPRLPAPIDLVGRDLGDEAPASRKWWVHWQGPLRVPATGTYRLWIVGRGDVTVSVDGAPVLRASGEFFREGASVPLLAGERSLEVKLARIGPGLRLRLGWTTPDGYAETIPPRLLGTQAAPLGWQLTDAFSLLVALLAAALAFRLRWDEPALLTWDRRITRAEVAASVAGHLALVILMSWPLALDLAHTGMVDRPDGRLNAWIMAWDVHALAHRVPLWDAPIFHPLPDALAFSENLLLPAILTAPLQAIGGPVLAYNVLLLLCLVLSGLATQLLARRVCDDRLAAFMAGAFFAVGAHRWIRLAHIQAQITFLLPLTLWAMDRFWAKRTWPRALLIGLLLGLQGLSSVYVGAITAMAASIVALLAAVKLNNKERLRLVAAGALAAAMVAPLGSAYLRMRNFEGMEFSLQEVATYATTLESYAASGTRLYGHITQRQLDSERVRDALFPGVILLVAGLVGLSKAPPRYRLAALVLSGTAIIFSLGPETAAYRFLHEHFIFIRGVRALSRFSLIPVLALSVLGGLAFVGRRGLALVALVLFLIESTNAPIRYASYEGPSEAARWLAGREGAVAYLPLGDNDTQAMLDGIAHWRPLVNGDSGFIPRSYDRAMELFGGEQLADDGLRFLRAVGVRHIVTRDERPLPLAASFGPEHIYDVPAGESAQVVASAPAVATVFGADGVQLDLGVVGDVRRVAFEPDARPWVAHPRVQVSADGVQWAAIDAHASLADATLSLMRDPRHGLAEVTFAAIRARYVRLPPNLPASPLALMVE